MTLSWAFDDEDAADTSALDALREGVALVPALWAFEVANGLATGLRRGRTSVTEVDDFLEDLSLLDIRVDDVAPSLGELVSGASQHDLTTYDAAYLLLAQRHRLPLATCDRRLQTAAERSGIALIAGT